MNFPKLIPYILLTCMVSLTFNGYAGEEEDYSRYTTRSALQSGKYEQYLKFRDKELNDFITAPETKGSFVSQVVRKVLYWPTAVLMIVSGLPTSNASNIQNSPYDRAEGDLCLPTFYSPSQCDSHYESYYSHLDDLINKADQHIEEANTAVSSFVEEGTEYGSVASVE